MLSIGHVARHGRVSVRMLRHYDAIGLLRPAYVDRVSAMDNVIPTIISQHSTCRQAGANRNPGSGDSGVLTENSSVYAGSESDGTSGSSTPSASASLRTPETWGSFVLPCSVN
jgi:hypothetical protein